MNLHYVPIVAYHKMFAAEEVPKVADIHLLASKTFAAQKLGKIIKLNEDVYSDDARLNLKLI